VPGGDEAALGRRKSQHLDICLDKKQYRVESGSTLLEHVHFIHRALPEIDAKEIDTTTDFLGHRVSAPILISSMTGGSDGGYAANKELASAAQQAGVPVGMGSIRILFRKPEVLEHFTLKGLAPDVPVMANIGGVQLREMEYPVIIEMLKRLEVQGLVVHLNAGQELAQPDGDRDFRGVLDAIRLFTEASPVPVLVKETGFGIGVDEVRKLFDAGVAYVNVAGAGGTNWAQVEGHRLPEAEAAVAREFEGWGLPSGLLLYVLSRSFDRLVASGGLRTGMDLAKAIALGACMGGFALPLIRAVDAGGKDAVIQRLEHYRAVLRGAMTLTGSRTLTELQRGKVYVEPALAELARSYSSAVASSDPSHDDQFRV